MTNCIIIDDIKILLQSRTDEWRKLSSDAQGTVKKVAREIIALKQTTKQIENENKNSNIKKTCSLDDSQITPYS